MIRRRKEKRGKEKGKEKRKGEGSGGEKREKGGKKSKKKRRSGQWRKRKMSERSAVAAVITPSSTGLDSVSCEWFGHTQKEDTALTISSLVH